MRKFALVIVVMGISMFAYTLDFGGEVFAIYPLP